MKTKIVALITGFIGSGKSTVAQYFKDRYGISVFYSDVEAKKLYDDPNVLAEVRKKFGDNIFFDDGTLNKAALAAEIFSDSNKKKELEDLIHPLVRKNFDKWKEKQNSRIVLMESAIALKRGREGFDYVILVEAPQTLRLKRTMERDNSSRDAVLARMNSQEIDDSLVDFFIDNEYDFRPSADACIKEICNQEF